MLLIALALLANDPIAPMTTDPLPRPMAVTVTRDAITDAVSAVATLYDRSQRLDISCAPSRYRGYRISLHATQWLGRGDLITGERPIIYRFDDQEPRNRIWLIRDRRALLNRQRPVRTFIDSLRTARQLTFRARDVEEHRLDIRFRLEGAATAIAALETACADAARPD